MYFVVLTIRKQGGKIHIVVRNRLENGSVRYVPDESGETGGHLYLRDSQEKCAKSVCQPQYSRVIDYSKRGRLLRIEFLDAERIDLRNLPQDEVIPQDLALIEIFNAHGVTPEVGADLLPE